MAFFNPRKKQVEYETEMNLPSYDVDVNGFLLFDDTSLGGCGIFEIQPRVMTDAMTHTDATHPEKRTDDPRYVSSTTRYFSDRRRDVYPVWVDFINSLQAENESEDPIHIQILLKKGRTDEWNTACDYALLENQNAIKEALKEMGYNNSRPTDLKSALLMRRANDYISLIKETTQFYYDESYFTNPKKLYSYQTKMYMIVSYTPSSEGWWIDGRDNDYYVTDNWSPNSLFREDKLVDKISSFFLERREKKTAENEINTAKDIFLIETDKTAYIIETRMKKIESKLATYGPDSPFLLRRLTKNETAAIIAFYPNLLTPYMKEIDKLTPSYNDIYHAIDNRMAIATGDYNLTDDLKQDIIYGQVDLHKGKEAQEEFLAKYKGLSRGDVGSFKDEFEDRFWNAEDEYNRTEDKKQLDPDFVRRENMWKDLSPDFTIDNTDKNDKQRAEEYLNRLRNKSLNIEHTIIHEEEQRRIFEEENKKRKRNPNLDNTQFFDDTNHSGRTPRPSQPYPPRNQNPNRQNPLPNDRGRQPSRPDNNPPNRNNIPPNKRPPRRRPDENHYR